MQAQSSARDSASCQMKSDVAGSHDLKGMITQLRVPPVPRVWGPGTMANLTDVAFRGRAGRIVANWEVTRLECRAAPFENLFLKSWRGTYRWLMSDAMQAAPKPLSMLTTDTFGEQVFSMPSSAATPPSDAP